MPVDSTNTGFPVPSRRLSRLWHLGRATTDFAAGVGVRGMIEMARTGGRGSSRIQLSPAATRRLTDRLARMRGAVMKMGQLMSMDGTDVFTPEAAEIMATLRDRAEPMPMSQLTRVLSAELGKDWNKAFRRFEFQPMAAASIGQVHRAETKDGRRLALKIQFPGVRESIDSDIDNLGFLARNLGMLPTGLDPQPLLDEARVQLHREADYVAEAASLSAYRALLGDDPDFFVPRVHPDLSTTRVLAMDFAEGVPIDRLADRRFRHDERDRAATLLTRLMLRELFEFRLAQTDPNFGNFLYQAETGRIVLLDFGATSAIAAELSETYRRLGQAATADDRDGLRQAALRLGYVGIDDPQDKVEALLDLIRLSGEVLQPHGPYDFGGSDLFERVYTRGRDMFLDERFTRFPDPSTMLLHRKFVGIFMLCRRLRARVDVLGLLEPYLAESREVRVSSAEGISATGASARSILAQATSPLG
jgi:predicted unusual protein kinase regulating ubiquinone biosynthesis (AarF/ABC1/UbiB family)